MNRATLTIALLLAVSTPAAAQTCAQDIEALQTANDAKLKEAAAQGPSATESTDAKLHHQPTPKSLQQAESRIGDADPNKGAAFESAMAKAHAAKDADNDAECRAALDEARAALKP